MDQDGNVVDTTTTRRDGSYSFQGVQIGTWHVTVDLPDGWETTTTDPLDVVVTKGQRFDRLNFGQRRLVSPASGPSSGLASDVPSDMVAVTDTASSIFADPIDRDASAIDLIGSTV
jgi:hypothetical protein